MSKILFFFTSEYPFGRGETFIENEISFLSSAFDKVVIISNTTENQKRNIPQNATVEFMPYELSKAQTFASVLGVFHFSFWRELSCIKKRYKKKLTSIIVKTALVSKRKKQIFQKRIVRIIQSHAISGDSLFAYSYWTNDVAVSLTDIKQKYQGIKVFSRAHGWDVYFEANKAQYLPFRQQILEKMDRIFFISNKGFEYYKNLFPEYEGKMRISKLGVQAQDITMNHTQDEIFRIVSCSNLIPLKRVHIIIEALALINSQKIEWIHFGDGFLRNELQQLANEKLGDKHNISYCFAGTKPNSEILDFYRRTDVRLFLNVSTTEGIPVSIMEAMSFGIPCFATQVGGNSEIVTNQNGKLLPSDINPRILSDEIQKYIELPEEITIQYRNNAYNTWEMNYNANANFAMFVKEILSL